MCLYPHFSQNFENDGQDVALDLFSMEREHCPIDKVSEIEDTDGVIPIVRNKVTICICLVIHL